MRALLICLLLIGGFPALGEAQVRGLTWADPTLRDAIRDADLIVLARALRVAKNGVAYEVEQTLKGPKRDGHLLAVTGLHHPELRHRPPVQSGDLDYLLLRGKPTGEGFALPTPTLGRFPCRVLSGRPLVVASLGGSETFVRIAVPQSHFEALLRGINSGKSKELLGDARVRLSGKSLPGPERVYWALRCLGLFGSRADRDLLPQIRRAIEKAGPRSATFRLRAAAATALARIGGRGAIQTLLGLLRDPHRGVQSAAAEGLSRVVADMAGSNVFELVVKRLVEFAGAASQRPVTFTSVEDPRTNRIDAPLAAALKGLARLAVPEGLRLARRTLKTEDLDTIDAGLAYFEERGDPRLVPILIKGMRPKGHTDHFVNRRFARVLSLLTKEDYGLDPQDWQAWWESKHTKSTPKDGK
ncbi:MAG: HEAT repeat domain-containing protein [Planctomycetes bacterium]|nr:HEAT repeat domain-containing protein [Planctomycetota bacterium]